MSQLTPERLAEVKSESGQQIALFCWAAMPTTQQQLPGVDLMFHIPNGGSRDSDQKIARQRGGVLKAEGVKAGVSDIFLPVPLHGWRGFWLELKYGVNKPSVEQLEFLTRMSEHGYKTGIYWTFEAARQAIVDYYRGT